MVGTVSTLSRFEPAYRRVVRGLRASLQFIAAAEIGDRCCPLMVLAAGLSPTTAEYYVTRSILAREWGPDIFAREADTDTLLTVLAATAFRVALFGCDTCCDDFRRYLA